MNSIYKLTAALLVAHEIDCAYWREWDLYGLPGGIELFVAIHVALALIVLWGQEQISRGTRAGFWMATAVGVAALATATVHGSCLARGAAPIHAAGSLLLVAASLLSGAALLASTATAPRAALPEPE